MQMAPKRQKQIPNGTSACAIDCVRANNQTLKIPSQGQISQMKASDKNQNKKYLNIESNSGDNSPIRKKDSTPNKNEQVKQTENSLVKKEESDPVSPGVQIVDNLNQDLDKDL